MSTHNDDTAEQLQLEFDQKLINDRTAELAAIKHHVSTHEMVSRPSDVITEHADAVVKHNAILRALREVHMSTTGEDPDKKLTPEFLTTLFTVYRQTSRKTAAMDQASLDRYRDELMNANPFLPASESGYQAQNMDLTSMAVWDDNHTHTQ